MNNDSLTHRRVYDVEVGHQYKTRTFGVYNLHGKEFIVIVDGRLDTYVDDMVVVFEELTLELPESIPLEDVLAVCDRHSRKLVYTSQPSRGGVGWVHYDDRVPCNEHVQQSANMLLIDFLKFLDSMS